MGNMQRGCDCYDAERGTKLATLRDAEKMTAIPSRNAAHPSARLVACGTASGRVHVFRA